MISIAEIFDNSKELLDSISGFVDKYIGTELLRKCHITKVVDNVQERGIYDYHDNPLLRLIGSIKESRFLDQWLPRSCGFENCKRGHSVYLHIERHISTAVQR